MQYIFHKCKMVFVNYTLNALKLNFVLRVAKEMKHSLLTLKMVENMIVSTGYVRQTW
jgi:hypothetical protein